VETSSSLSAGLVLRMSVIIALCAVVTAASITIMYLGMRDVMEIGGVCASGGPFEIRVECPDGTWAIIVAAFAGLIAVMVWGAAGSYLGSPRLYLLAWPALFISLGYNFLDGGLNVVEGRSSIGDWVLASTFFAMGGIPLVIALLNGTVRNAVFGANKPFSAAGLAASPLGATASGFDLTEIEHALRAAGFDDSRSAGDSPRTFTSTTVTVNGAPVDASQFHGQSLGEIIRQATTLGGQMRASVSQSPETEADASMLATDLELLAQLHRSGSLTDEQFEAAKAARIAHGGT
jgi:hypothetical protein